MSHKLNIVSALSNPLSPKLTVTELVAQLEISAQSIRKIVRANPEFTSTKVNKLLYISLANHELVENEMLEVILAPKVEVTPKVEAKIQIGSTITFLYDGESLTRKVSYITKDGLFTVAYKGSTLNINPTTVIGA